MVFREVNERLREISETFASDGSTMDVVCECGRQDCIERVRLSLAAYDRVRRASGFVMKAEHEPADGAVVDRGEGYVVVGDDGSG